MVLTIKIYVCKFYFIKRECLSDSGYKQHISAEKHKPAYEKLLDWVCLNYSKSKELKKYKLIW